MIELLLALSLTLLTGFWLILRRLKDLPLTVKLITALTVSVLFLRTILGQTYFFSPQLLFQILVFSFGFIYIVYLYIVANFNPKLNSIDHQLCCFQNAEDKLFVLFILGLAISACFSVYKHASISSVVYFSSLFVWYKLISNLPKSENVSRMFQTIILFACLSLIIYGFYQYFIGFQSMREFLAKNPEEMINSREFIRRMQSNVVFATFLYAPAFGCYLSMMFLTILGFCLSEGSLFKPRFKLALLLKYIVLLSIIPLLILTKAKGAWLSLLVSLLWFIFLLKLKTGQKKFLGKALLILISVCGVSFFLISSSDKIHLPKLADFIASFAVRWEYWKATWAMICQRPFFGFGPGTFSSVYPLFKTLNAEETVMAHNSFLQIWAEAGSFVFIIFLVFWLKFLEQAMLKLQEISDKSRFIIIGLFSSIICFLFINLIDFSLFDQQTALIAFGLIGLLQYHISYEQTNDLEPKESNRQTKAYPGLLKMLSIFLGFLYLAVLIWYSSLMYTASFFDEKASREYKNNNLAQALVLTGKAINLQGNCAKYYFHQGLVLEKISFTPNISTAEKNNLLNQTINSFQKAVDLDYFVPHYHYRLAVVLFNSEQAQAQQNAEIEFKKASELYPVNPFYHEQLAQFYDIIGHPEQRDEQKKQAEYYKKFYKTGTR